MLVLWGLQNQSCQVLYKFNRVACRLLVNLDTGSGMKLSALFLFYRYQREHCLNYLSWVITCSKSTQFDMPWTLNCSFCISLDNILSLNSWWLCTLRRFLIGCKSHAISPTPLPYYANVLVTAGWYWVCSSSTIKKPILSICIHGTLLAWKGNI